MPLPTQAALSHRAGGKPRPTFGGGVPAGPCAHGRGNQAAGDRAPKGQLVIGASDRGQHAKKEQAAPPHANVDAAQLWGVSRVVIQEMGNAASALGKVGSRFLSPAGKQASRRHGCQAQM